MMPSAAITVPSRPPELIRVVGSVALFALVLALVVFNLVVHLPAVGQFDDAHWGLGDFRDAVYYPCHAVSRGINPYDTKHYLSSYAGEVNAMFPMYSPLTLLLHYPLCYLPFSAAGVVYQCLQLVCMLLTIVTVYYGLHHKLSGELVLITAALVLFSQPGQSNWNYGQVTWPLVLCSYLTLGFARNRPLLAGVCLGLASFKPTYAAPIGLLLLFRGDWKTVVWGILFSVMGVLLGLLMMMSHGISLVELPEVLFDNHLALSSAAGVDPRTSDSRVDIQTLLARLSNSPWDARLSPFVAPAVLLITGLAIWRIERFRGENRLLDTCANKTFDLTSPSNLLLCVGTLLGIYRFVYDLLLLLLPAIVAWQTLARGSQTRWRWWVVRLLILIPAVNFLWTGPGQTLGMWLEQFLGADSLPSRAWLWGAVTIINPLALCGLWLFLIAMSTQLFSRSEGCRVDMDKPSTMPA